MCVVFFPQKFKFYFINPQSWWNFNRIVLGTEIKFRLIFGVLVLPFSKKDTQRWKRVWLAIVVLIHNQAVALAMYFYFVLQNVYTINRMSEGFIVFVNDLQPLVDFQTSSFGIIFAIDWVWVIVNAKFAIYTCIMVTTSYISMRYWCPLCTSPTCLFGFL